MDLWYCFKPLRLERGCNRQGFAVIVDKAYVDSVTAEVDVKRVKDDLLRLNDNINYKGHEGNEGLLFGIDCMGRCGLNFNKEFLKFRLRDSKKANDYYTYTTHNCSNEYILSLLFHGFLIWAENVERVKK